MGGKKYVKIMFFRHVFCYLHGQIGFFVCLFDVRVLKTVFYGDISFLRDRTGKSDMFLVDTYTGRGEGV